MVADLGLDVVRLTFTDETTLIAIVPTRPGAVPEATVARVGMGYISTAVQPLLLLGRR